MAETALPPLLPSPYGRLFREGQPWVWITRATTALLLLMVAAIVGLVLVNGLRTFWPRRLVRHEMKDGSVVVGEVIQREVHHVGQDSRPQEEIQVRVGNRDVVGIGRDFRWIVAGDVVKTTVPDDLLSFERTEYGPAYGRVRAVLEDGKPAVEGAGAVPALRERMRDAERRRKEQEEIQRGELAEIQHRGKNLEALQRRAAAIEDAQGPAAAAALQKEAAEQKLVLDAEYERVFGQVKEIQAEDARHQVLLEDGAGNAFPAPLAISHVLRVDEVNRAGFFGRVGLFLGRLWRFVTDRPREANTDGGIWPAIFGTMLMTILMTIVVVPFGVLTALYLREYAKQGWAISLVRIAVNNLAGVPSIVFGVFGLGFFCYMVGGWIDRTWFSDFLPSPTFGGGGILWASLTLALLTVPVVIVATEEALAAVPKSMREAAIACGASKWQTIRRIVIPYASPGILTGAILAMARGAGEVAPLMLTGVVKSVEELPVDGEPPFLHPERRFMHLGFHIYDTGFQSPNVDASTPLVYSTTLVLLVLVLVLNLGATLLRNRLRRRFRSGVFG
jgi:phosphate transport system permease protein